MGFSRETEDIPVRAATAARTAAPAPAPAPAAAPSPAPTPPAPAAVDLNSLFASNKVQPGSVDASVFSSPEQAAQYGYTFVNDPGDSGYESGVYRPPSQSWNLTDPTRVWASRLGLSMDQVNQLAKSGQWNSIVTKIEDQTSQAGENGSPLGMFTPAAQLGLAFVGGAQLLPALGLTSPVAANAALGATSAAVGGANPVTGAALGATGAGIGATGIGDTVGPTGVGALTGATKAALTGGDIGAGMLSGGVSGGVSDLTGGGPLGSVAGNAAGGLAIGQDPTGVLTNAAIRGVGALAQSNTTPPMPASVPDFTPAPPPVSVPDFTPPPPPMPAPSVPDFSFAAPSLPDESATQGMLAVALGSGITPGGGSLGLSLPPVADNTPPVISAPVGDLGITLPPDASIGDPLSFINTGGSASFVPTTTFDFSNVSGAPSLAVPQTQNLAAMGGGQGLTPSSGAPVLLPPQTPNLNSMGGGQGITVPSGAPLGDVLSPINAPDIIAAAPAGTVTQSGMLPVGTPASLGNPTSFINQGTIAQPVPALAPEAASAPVSVSTPTLEKQPDAASSSSNGSSSKGSSSAGSTAASPAANESLTPPAVTPAPVVTPPPVATVPAPTPAQAASEAAVNPAAAPGEPAVPAALAVTAAQAASEAAASGAKPGQAAAAAAPKISPSLVTSVVNALRAGLGQKPAAPGQPASMPTPTDAPARQAGQSDAQYSQALIDYVSASLGALASLTQAVDNGQGQGEGQGNGQGQGAQPIIPPGLVDLSAQHMADLGLKPGSQDYYQYIMSQLDEVLGRLFNGLDPNDASFAEKLHAKTGQEMEALYRVLYARGVIDQLMGSGKYTDPFTGISEDVISNSGDFNPGMGAYQRGLARDVNQLRGMTPDQARMFIGGMLDRNPDLYGMRSAANYRRIMEAMASGGLRRKRGMFSSAFDSGLQ